MGQPVLPPEAEIYVDYARLSEEEKKLFDKAFNSPSVLHIELPAVPSISLSKIQVSDASSHGKLVVSTDYKPVPFQEPREFVPRFNTASAEEIVPPPFGSQDWASYFHTVSLQQASHIPDAAAHYDQGSIASLPHYTNRLPAASYDALAPQTSGCGTAEPLDVTVQTGKRWPTGGLQNEPSALRLDDCDSMPQHPAAGAHQAEDGIPGFGESANDTSSLTVEHIALNVPMLDISTTTSSEDLRRPGSDAPRPERFGCEAFMDFTKPLTSAEAQDVSSWITTTEALKSGRNRWKGIVEPDLILRVHSCLCNCRATRRDWDKLERKLHKADVLHFLKLSYFETLKDDGGHDARLERTFERSLELAIKKDSTERIYIRELHHQLRTATPAERESVMAEIEVQKDTLA